MNHHQHGHGTGTERPQPWEPDPDRDRVHAAEQDVRLGLEHLGHAGSLHFHGVMFSPETEPRFSSPDDVRAHVQRVYRHLAEAGTDFARQVEPPAVRTRRGFKAAHYEPESATIAIPDHTNAGNWALRGLVVWHEIAHHLAGEAGHGPGFRSTFLRLLEALGLPEISRLMLKSFEDRGLGVLGYDVDEHTLETMTKILQRAEDTDSEAERETCLARVQRLATRHQVALAVLRSRSDDQAAPEVPVEETIEIGRRGQRSLWCYVNLMTSIMAANNLQGVVSGGNTSVTLLGFRSDLEVAKTLFYSLVRQMHAAWERHLAREPEEFVYADRAMTRVRKVATITRKNAFFGEFGSQVGRRLSAAREEALAEELGEGPGLGDDEENPFAPGPDAQADAAGVTVALRDRELAVTDAYEEMVRRWQVRRSWRHPADAVFKAPGTALAGMDAAQQASLGTEKELDRN